MGQKGWGGTGLSCNFPTLEDSGAKNFNFALEVSQNKGFYPFNFVFFSRQKKIYQHAKMYGATVAHCLSPLPQIKCEQFYPVYEILVARERDRAILSEHA